METRKPYKGYVEEGKARRLLTVVLNNTFKNRYELEFARFSFSRNSSIIATVIALARAARQTPSR